MPTSAADGRPRHTGGSSVLGWVMPHLMAHLTRNGYDADPIRRLPGFVDRDFTDPDVRLPESAAHEAWQMAATMTGDDALGVHVAESLPAGALDLVEYSFRSSATLEAGLERLARYGRLINDRFVARLLPTSRHLHLVLGSMIRQPTHPQRAEFALAVVVRFAREGTVPDLAPLEVAFAHEAPRSVHEQRRFFAAPLRFSSEVYALTYGENDGARQLGGADPALAGIVRRRLDKALVERDRSQDGSMTTRVRRCLLEEVGTSQPSAAHVARTVGVSVRTLTRRLDEERTSFRAILDRVRADAAATLLRDRAVGIGEIAFFLGYSEPAAFHRSFKRWTGKTPLEYRRELVTR